MEYIKLQKEILTNALKDKVKFNVQTTDESVYLTDNGYQIFIFPQNEFYLDLKKLMQGKVEMKIKDMLKIDGEDGHLTNEMKVLPSKTTVVKIASENNHSWVNKKLLDRYKIKQGLHFTVPKSNKIPLLVWEDEMLCGMILPVNVKEDDDNGTI